MNELDKLFKNKLRDKEFEFKDSYWAAAEQLIEQEESRRKRGGLWWRLGLFLLVFALVGYFMMNEPASASVSGAEGTTIPLKSNSESEISNSKSQNQSEGEIPVAESIDQSVSNVGEIIPNNVEAPVLRNVEEVSSYEINSQQTNFSPKGASTTNQSDVLQNSPPKPDVKTLDADLLKADTSARQPDTKTKKKLDMADNSEIIEQSQSKESLDVKAEKLVASELAFLETKPSTLEIPDAECKDCFELDKIKYRPKRFAFGLATEGLYYPKGTYENGWYGGAVGGTVKYRMSRKISIRSGLQLAVIKGMEYAPISDRNGVDEDYYRVFDSSVDYQYGFGLRTVSTYYNPKSLQLLELPLMVQLQHKRHAVEAGVLMSVLLGVKGNTIVENSLYPWEPAAFGNPPEADMLVSESSGITWLPDNNFRKFTTNIALGYEYSLSPQIMINLSSYFSLAGNPAPLSHDKNGGFDSTISSASNNSSPSIDGGRFHFRAGAKWYFKK